MKKTIKTNTKCDRNKRLALMGDEKIRMQNQCR